MSSAPPKKLALLFIFITILVDVIGIGIIIPVIPGLIEKLTGEPLNDAAQWAGWLMMAFSVTQFLFAPMMGELSDRFGRKPVLILALAGLGLDYIFHAVAPTIGWLILSRLLAGVCGASFTVATAYIADVSTPATKAKNFGLVGAAFGIGFMIGPAIGGFCADWGVQAPFFVAAAFSLLNCIFGIFVIPESLPPENRRKFNWARTIPGVSLIHMKKYGALLGLLLAFILVNMAGQVMPATWSFFTMQAYGWDAKMVGISLMIVGLMVGLVQGGLTGLLVRKFGNKLVITSGFVFWTAGMLTFAFAANEVILYIALLPYVIGGIAGPTVQGLMSNRVPVDEQGNLQGVMTGMMSLTAIAGPPLYTTLFWFFGDKETDHYFPGAAFAMGAIFLMLATVVALLALRKMGDINTAPPSDNPEILDSNPDQSNVT